MGSSMASGSNGKKAGKGKRGALLVVEIACVIVALVCIWLIAQELYKYWSADQGFKNVVQTYDRDVDRLVTDNPDCVGWISADDTRIDYPVMFTPNDPEFYLHRNFESEYSSAGTPFMGEGSDPNGNSFIIYGHHMNDGSMFADLLKFDDEAFGKSHSFVYKTFDGPSTYQPIACWYEDLTSGDYYHYWEQVGNLSEQQFNDYVAAAKGMSLYETGVNAKYGDKLMTLSTCSYGTSDQRFVVVAVKH